MRRVLSVLAVSAILLAPGIARALVRIDIDLSEQRMHVESDSGEIYDWAISSGRPGHLTPRGVFRPIALYPMVHSLKYDNAPMPHSIFFLTDYAIHGTNAVGHLGRPASHGCVRLAPGAAARLYAMVQAEGATIRIHGDIGAFEANSPPSFPTPRHRARRLRDWTTDPFGEEPMEPLMNAPRDLFQDY